MKRKIEYKWVVAGICFLMVFAALGLCSSNKSLYLGAITDALGVPRSAFSLNDTCRYVTQVIINMFFGALVNKFGTKKLMCAGFLCLAASSTIYAFAKSIYIFYIGGVFLGLGLSWTTTTMVGFVVGKWFSEKKGTVMGAVLAANGVGAALSAQIVTPIIYKSTFGYRNAYLLSAGFGILIFLIILLFYRDKKDGVTYQKKSVTGERGAELSDILKMPYFYAAAVCIFFTGAILQGINGIVATYLRDVGISSTFMATVLSVQSLILTGSKFFSGFIYDKKGLRFASIVCDMSAVIVMTALSLVTNSPVGYALAMSYALFASLALPLETVMIPIFALDLFGERSYNKVLGIFVSVNYAGFAVGTPIMNLFFDNFGSYRYMFVVCAVVMAIITIAFQFVITLARRKVENYEKV